MTREDIPVGHLIEEIPDAELRADKRRFQQRFDEIEAEIYALEVQQRLLSNSMNAIDEELRERRLDREETELILMREAMRLDAALASAIEKNGGTL